MKLTRLGISLSAAVLAVVLAVAGAAGGCAHPPPPEVVGPPLPFVGGTYDCAAPTTWTTTSFAGLVPTVQRAFANVKPDGALTVLLSSHTDQEVTCVAGYIHDESIKQQATATDKELAARRVTATSSWIDQQSARGLVVTNYGGEAH